MVSCLKMFVKESSVCDDFKTHQYLTMLSWTASRFRWLCVSITYIAATNLLGAL